LGSLQALSGLLAKGVLKNVLAEPGVHRMNPKGLALNSVFVEIGKSVFLRIRCHELIGKFVSQSFPRHLQFPVMAYDPRFGPAAQTPQQRAFVLRQLQQTFPQLATPTSGLAQQFFDRYVAGEITWADVRRALDAANLAAAKPCTRRGR
jgi:hypothetical protein